MKSCLQGDWRCPRQHPALFVLVCRDGFPEPVMINGAPAAHFMLSVTVSAPACPQRFGFMSECRVLITPAFSLFSPTVCTSSAFLRLTFPLTSWAASETTDVHLHHLLSPGAAFKIRCCAHLNGAGLLSCLSTPYLWLGGLDLKRYLKIHFEVETESRMVVVRVWVQGKIGELLLMDIELQFCKMKRDLKTDASDGCITIQCT